MAFGVEEEVVGQWEEAGEAREGEEGEGVATEEGLQQPGRETRSTIREYGIC